jgi:hypothetical protein
MYEDSVVYAQAAVDIDSANTRLKSNLEFCKAKLT